VWAIVKIIIHCFSVMVMAYVMNQSKGHWLLSNSTKKIFKYMTKFMISIPIIKDICEIINHSLVIV